jgi:histidine phosphotransferase ChpT
MTTGERRNSADLAALVGSRICHDLVNPLGALGNGLELLALEGDPKLAEMRGLLAESLAAATARVQYFRIAFGNAPAERMAEAQIARIVTDYTAGRRLRIHWNAKGDRSRAEVRLAFLILLCLEASMPRGGRIDVGAERGILLIDARAEDMRCDTLLFAALMGHVPMPEAGPALVQFPLAAAAIEAFMRPIGIALGDGVASIRI